MLVAHACMVQRLPQSPGRKLHAPPMEWPVSMTGHPGKRSAAACSAAYALVCTKVAACIIPSCTCAPLVTTEHSTHRSKLTLAQLSVAAHRDFSEPAL